LSAIALLEALLGEGIASLGAAARVLADGHTLLGDGESGVDSGVAIAAEDRLSIDNNVIATAVKVVAALESKVLAEGQRRVGHAANA